MFSYTRRPLLICFFVTFFVPPHAKGEPVFTPPESYTAGPIPSVSGIRDLNGDGIPDIVVANQGYSGQPQNSVSVFLGKGQGRFHPKKDYPLPLGPNGRVRLGEVNGDGKIDMVSNDSAKTGILLGQGDGTFLRGTETPLPRTGWEWILGDVNGDRLDDLIFLEEGGIRIYLNEGDGAFRPFDQELSYPQASVVRVGDLNHDGKADLAVLQGGALVVLTRHADGKFYMAHVQTFATGATQLVKADLNADGNADLIIGDDAAMNVLLGKGDGTFRPPVRYSAGEFPYLVQAGDFDGDGKTDLSASTVDAGGVASLLVLPGRGDGTFIAPVSVGLGAFDVRVADMNGDGKADLLTTGQLIPGIGDGAFGESIAFTTGEYPRALAVGDFDRDGINDAVVTQTPGSLTVLLGTRGGSLQRHVDYHTFVKWPSAAVAGEFNGDGSLDLAVTGDGKIHLLYGEGDGAFRSGPAFETAVGTHSITTGDWNRDGIPDLAAATSNESLHRFVPNTVSVLIGNREGSFTVQRYDAGPAQRIGEGEFNGDSFPDLLAGGSIFLGQGDGTFQRTRINTFASYTFAAGDLNGDGKEDLVEVSGSDGALVRIRFGNGDSTFQTPSVVHVGKHVRSLDLGDVNGDRRTDLVATSLYETTVFAGLGEGRFLNSLRYELPHPYRNSYRNAAADLDGDGLMDLVTANETTVGVYLNRTLLMGDVNRDGTVDVADVHLVLLSIIEAAALNEGQARFADMNRNARIDIADAVLILRRIVGL